MSQQLTINYWNYFLALEEDLEQLSRFVEFNPDNFKTYSIELAQLLLTSSSEIDVLLKQICSLIAPKTKVKNIDDYRETLKNNLQTYIFDSFINEKIYIPRYHLVFTPWSLWKNDDVPEWWRSYNNVKHKRDSSFMEANLENVIKSIGALLTVEVYYYWISGHIGDISVINVIDAENTRRETIWNLEPCSEFVKLDGNYYPQHLAV